MESFGEMQYTKQELKRRKGNLLDWFNHYKAKGCNDRKAMECARRKNNKQFHL